MLTTPTKDLVADMAHVRLAHPRLTAAEAEARAHLTKAILVLEQAKRNTEPDETNHHVQEHIKVEWAVRDYTRALTALVTAD